MITYNDIADNVRTLGYRPEYITHIIKRNYNIQEQTRAVRFYILPNSKNEILSFLKNLYAGHELNINYLPNIEMVEISIPEWGKTYPITAAITEYMDIEDNILKNKN
jgi:hypothetical protein